MITWILDLHVDKVRNAPTPFVEEAKKRNHTIFALRNSLIPGPIDLTNVKAIGPTIVRGSVGFVKFVQNELHPTPGGFLNFEQFTPAVISKTLKKLSLNHDYEILDFKTFMDNRKKIGEKIFIKPLNDQKLFNGIVLHENESLDDAHYSKYRRWTVPPDDCQVFVSPAQEIGTEYRIVVVDGVPISGSTYKIDWDNNVPQKCMEMAAQAASIHNPSGAYVIDVAETPKGVKVVEYNQFGTSGLYACDQVKIVDALEKLLCHQQKTFSIDDILKHYI
jgi:ATP-grasp domain, R2K clade family 3